VSEDRRAFLRGIVRSAAGQGGAPPAAEPLGEADVERYSRQLVLPQWSERAQLALQDASVLVNSTPIGMQGEPPPFAVEALDGRALVLDTVYHPAETPLLIEARARGVPAANGLGMLVHQAAVSFELFTGVAAPLDAMRAAAGG